ncbi:unnamed protein product [Closterium sp. Naga37s-1]|nr:unnamed protein product [Closterium sp. Naga37s-1]
MWKRDSHDVYEALKAFEWSPAVQPMVAAVTDRYTHTMIQLLARSFSTISPSHAATFLGLTSQEALSFREHSPLNPTFPIRCLLSVFRKAHLYILPRTLLSCRNTSKFFM